MQTLSFGRGDGWRVDAFGSDFTLSPLTAPDRVAIGPLEAAFCETGEEHESGSEDGMTVIVLEGDVAPYLPTA